MADESFQRRVEEWLRACFPADVRSDNDERTHRFLEEALELAQANGCSAEDAEALVRYVFSRPKGTPELEVGGVMVTLAGLCCTSRIDLAQAATNELRRNWLRLDAIREKQAYKPEDSALPQ